MDYYTQLEEKIIRKLKEKGYTNKPIDYCEFKEIYAPYEEDMSEIEFAEIIAIKYGNYKKLKNKEGRRAIILKEERVITAERKAEIIKELKEKGYTNRSIDYNEFKEIYAPYEEEMREANLGEVDFAEIIGIKYGNYSNLKNKEGRRTIILKEERVITAERKAEIIRELKEKGYTNKLIEYDEFKEIYAPYEEEMIEANLKEADFALIIGIKTSYNAFKKKKRRAVILKEGGITEERKAEIVRELKEKGYTNRSIDYDEFKEIYAPYEKEMIEANLKEADFALIIGIKTNYSAFKKKKKRAIILKEEKKEITAERKIEIIRELKERGYTNKPIEYDEFKEIYAPYEEEMIEANLGEVDFAEIIGIRYNNFNALKNCGQRAIILKEERVITAERKAEIIRELKEKGYTNKLIEYDEFKEIYEPYEEEMIEANLGEVDFAEIIGIKYGNYNNLKSGQRAMINFDIGKIDKIKHLLGESRYYTSKELEEISLKVNTDLDELINLATKRNKNETTEGYKNIIREKGIIYIGRTKIRQEFIDRYANELLNYSNNISKMLGKKYNLNQLSEDIASEMLTKVIQTRGDIVNNYEEDDAIQILKSILYVEIKYKYMNKLKIKIVYSIDKETDGKNGNKTVGQRWIIDKKRDTEREAIENIENTESIVNIQDTDDLYEVCVSMLNKCYQNGMNNKQSINLICKKIGIEKKQLLEIMQKYLIERKKAKLTENGEYIQGERA